MVEQSKAGNPVDLVEVSAVAVTPKLCQLDQLPQVVVSLLQPALADSMAEGSVVALVVVGAVDSEEASVAATEDTVEEEEVSDTKVEVVLAEGAERLMAMVTQRHPLMLLQVPAETEVASVQVGIAAHLVTAA